MMTFPPAPDYLRIDASEHLQKFIDCVKKNGAVIIKNLATQEQIDRVNEETRPYIENDKPWLGKIFPPETRRCNALISRSPTTRDFFLVNPLVTGLVSEFCDKTTTNWYGEKQYTYTSKAHLDTSLSMEIGPGGKAQRLHRDDKNFHGEHKDQTATGYQPHADVCIGFLIAGVNSTEENGATQVIPGSHLWGDDRPPKLVDAYVATMNRGDALCFLGSLYHAGGENRTVDQRRTIHSIFFTRGYYRQEEIQLLIHSKEEVLSWTPQVQQLMGYHISSPNCGYIEFVSAVDYMSGAHLNNEVLVDLDPDDEETAE